MADDNVARDNRLHAGGPPWLVARTALFSLAASVAAACGGEQAAKPDGAISGDDVFAGDPCLAGAAYQLTMIHDFETNQAFPRFMTNDASGLDPNPALQKGASRVAAGRCGGAAEHIVNVVTGWGMQYYFSYSNSGSPIFPFDASAAEGVSFWIKRGNPNGGDALVTFLSESHTDDTEIARDAGVRGAGPDGGKFCNSLALSDAGKCDPFIHGVGLTDDWRFVTIPFPIMRQKGYGVPAPFLDPARIHAVGFQVVAGSWDFWIDDVAFYRARPSPVGP